MYLSHRDFRGSYRLSVLPRLSLENSYELLALHHRTLWGGQSVMCGEAGKCEVPGAIPFVRSRRHFWLGIQSTRRPFGSTFFMLGVELSFRTCTQPSPDHSPWRRRGSLITLTLVMLAPRSGVLTSTSSASCFYISSVTYINRLCPRQISHENHIFLTLIAGYRRVCGLFY